MITTPERVAQQTVRVFNRWPTTEFSESWRDGHYMTAWLACQASVEIAEKLSGEISSLKRAKMIVRYAGDVFTSQEEYIDHCGMLMSYSAGVVNGAYGTIVSEEEYDAIFATDEHHRQFLIERLARLMNHNLSEVQGLGTEGEQ